MTIRLSEQVLLLALNETSGKIYPLPEQYLDFAVAGALIMELVFDEYVRLHQGLLRVLKAGPTGDAVLDTALSYLPAAGSSSPAMHALIDLAAHSSQLTAMLLDDLVFKGVLEPGSYRYLWFFSDFCQTDPKLLEATSVKKTLREILFQNRSPNEKEAVLVGIASVCNLMTHIFSPEDLRTAEPRIRKLVRFEIINHLISNALDEFQNAVINALAS